MASKAALLAAARSGGPAAVKALSAANPWPASVRSADGATYRFRSSQGGRGYYHMGERCVALSLEEAKTGSFS